MKGLAPWSSICQGAPTDNNLRQTGCADPRSENPDVSRQVMRHARKSGHTVSRITAFPPEPLILCNHRAAIPRVGGILRARRLPRYPDDERPEVPTPLNRVLFTETALFLTGCVAGSGGSASPPIQEVVITAQPLSQPVPVGQMGTFTITATGTAPLSYQWSENGFAIPGATSASYSTPVVQLGANGSTAIGSFRVTIRNAVNSVTSNTAALTAGPRSPRAGDLRYLLFQQVDLPGFTTTAGFGPVELGITEQSTANALGNPLSLSSTYVSNGGCEWITSYWFLPPPMTGFAMYYQEGFTNHQSYSSYLQSVAQPNIVITSMDLEPVCQLLGASWVLTAQGGNFDQRIETVPMGANLATEIQNQATLDGGEFRIVTAATIDDSGQQAVLLSYGWSGDTATLYESQAYVVPPNQIGATAATLANNGYFISGVGGNDTDGYILIGMRVKGDSLPRPISANGVAGTATLTSKPYSTLVIWYLGAPGISQDWTIWDQ